MLFPHAIALAYFFLRNENTIQNYLKPILPMCIPLLTGNQGDNDAHKIKPQLRIESANERTPNIRKSR